MIDKYTHPRTYALSAYQRMDWMRGFLGNWALVGLGKWDGDDSVVAVHPRAGLARPPT